MKDTSTWLQNLPHEWKIVQIKHLALPGRASFTDGDWIESHNISTEGIRYLTSGNIGEGKFKEQGNGFVAENVCRDLNCTYAYPGEFVFSRLNSPQGRSCILPDIFEKYVLAVDNVILRTGENKEYLNYVTQSKGYKESAKLKSSGSTMQRISRSDLGSIKIPLPPRNTQDSIVRFLNQTVKEVDAAITLKNQQLSHLASYRQSLITRAVTKGLDPNVEMKDSGVAWIGDIPKHWQISTLGRIGTFKGGDAFPVHLQGRSDNKISFYKVANLGIHKESIYLRKSENTITKEDAIALKANIINPGSIVYAKIGAALLLNRRRIVNEPCCILNWAQRVRSHALGVSFQAQSGICL